MQLVHYTVALSWWADACCTTVYSSTVYMLWAVGAVSWDELLSWWACYCTTVYCTAWQHILHSTAYTAYTACYWVLYYWVYCMPTVVLSACAVYVVVMISKYSMYSSWACCHSTSCHSSTVLSSMQYTVYCSMYIHCMLLYYMLLYTVLQSGYSWHLCCAVFLSPPHVSGMSSSIHDYSDFLVKALTHVLGMSMYPRRSSWTLHSAIRRCQLYPLY